MRTRTCGHITRCSTLTWGSRDVVLHGGDIATGVPAGLLLRDKGLLVSFATRALSADQITAVHALGSGQAAVGPLYILCWAEALTELTAFVEGDVASHWPPRRTAVAHKLRTKVLKTRMTGGAGLPWQEFKGVAPGNQQFPAIRGTTSEMMIHPHLWQAYIRQYCV